jgi:SnoaL-like domain
MSTVEERLGRLEDVEAARGILFDYAASLDEPDPAVVAALFTEDGLLHTVGGTCRGRAEIEEFFGRAFTRDPSTKRHFITNSKTTWLAPRRVRIDSYFFFVGRDVDRSVLGWGTYLDVVDVSGGRPRFAEKTIDVHLNTTLDQGWAR